MANINQVSIDGGTTLYDLEDSTARTNIEDIKDGTGIDSFADVETALASQQQLLEDTVGWNGKNLNKYPYYDSDTKTSAGIAYSVNADKSVNGNGTSTSTSQYICHSRTSETNDLVLQNGKYIINGCPNIQGCTIYIRCTKNGQSVTLGTDTGNGAEFTVDGDDNWQDKARVNVLIQVSSGTVLNNVTFKPMIRNAKITDDTYVPYHASVEESKADNSVIAPVENGTTASQAYAVGEHFIRNGKFCTVTQAIASGDTLTVNTNYVEGDVGSELTVIQDTLSVETISGISFSADVRYAYRYGKVVNFRFRFIANSDLTLSEITRFVTIPYAPHFADLIFICQNADTYVNLESSFRMGSDGRISFIGTIPTGTYDVAGTYICK